MVRLGVLLFAALMAAAFALPTKQKIQQMAQLRHLKGSQTLPQGGCESGFLRCQSGDVMEGNSTTVHTCIPDNWVCDNWNDCGDASDESLALCEANKCDDSDTNFWQCPKTNLCIPKIWLCDLWDDCGDDMDEPPHIDQATCEEAQGCLQVNKAARMRFLNKDAHSYSKHNNMSECSGGYVKCLNSDICIPGSFICDGWNDCGDASDEPLDECPTITCEVCTTRCPNSSICTYPQWSCDGDDDCGDGSEEQNCMAGRTHEYKTVRSSDVPKPTTRETLSKIKHRTPFGKTRGHH